MRCVSYTRTTSCCKNDSVQVYSIAEQNEHIKEYVRTNGIRLLKKYSDRKNDPDEISDFEKMRIDGLNRRFDLLIFDSFWQCGKDVFSIVRVLKDIFIPAGIHFAVVQDHYCSIDKNRDEVVEYLEKMWSDYRSHLTETRLAKSPLVHYVETYGYRYNREEDVLEIDEVTASIIREVFDKLLQGMLPGEIAQELTLRGIENPGDYLCRTKGWALKGNNRGWTGGTVSHLAKNPKLAGRWEKYVNGRNYADDCEPIIDPEKFDEVQSIFAQRRHHCKGISKYCNPFLKMMTDEETGSKVIMKKNSYTGLCDFHFQPRKPEGVRYEKTCMDYQEAISQILDLLRRERDNAFAAAEYMDSNEAQLYKEQLIDDKRKSIPELLEQLFYINEKWLSLNELKDSREIDEAEFAISAAAITIQKQAITDEIAKIYKEITNIEKSLSKDNPWIALFSRYDENHELTRSYLKVFCEHVKIWRFETIKPVFRETEWKNRIPMLLTEAQDGTYQQKTQ